MCERKWRRAGCESPRLEGNDGVGRSFDKGLPVYSSILFYKGSLFNLLVDKIGCPV